MRRGLALLTIAVLSLMLLAPSWASGPLLAEALQQTPSWSQGAAQPQERCWTREIELSFGPPRPLLDEGRLVGFSMRGCRLVPVGGLLVPAKVMVLKLDSSLEVRGVELVVEEEGRTRLPALPMAPISPMPLVGGEYRLEPEVNVGWLSGHEWLDYEVHYGIDPEDMMRKEFLVIRVFPARYDPVRRELAWVGRARLLVEFSAGAGVPVGPAQAKAVMLIITNDELEPAAEELASFKNSTGLTTVIRTLSWITAHYPGRDTQEQMRNCISDLVSTLGIKFVLIFGDHDVVPTRFVYVPDGYPPEDEETDTEDGAIVETDLYYADVLPAGLTWNNDGDDKWGELPDETLDLFPDVFLGRLPASTLEEAYAMVAKIKNYVGNLSSGDVSWFFRALMAGTDPFEEYAGPEGELVKDNITYSFSPKLWCIRLYQTRGNLTKASLMLRLNEGCGFVNFAGHGYPFLWYLGYEIVMSSDVENLRNGHKLPVVMAAACLTSRFSDQDCIGEYFLLNPSGGAIAYLGATRVAWMFVGEYATYGLAGLMDILFSRALAKGPISIGQAWAEAIINYTQIFDVYVPYEEDGTYYYIDWKTVAEYGTLFGDPSVLFYNVSLGPYSLTVSCLDLDGEHAVESVEVELLKGGSVVASGTSGPDGKVELTGLMVGSYVLRAKYQGVQVAGPISVFVPAVTSMDLYCRLLDLNLKVLDAGGEPLGNASVVLMQPAGKLEAISGPDGSVRIEDIPPALYTIEVYWHRPFRKLVYSGSLNLTMDEMTLTMSCEVFDFTIKVVDLWGRPVKDASVSITTGNGTPVGTFKTGANGSITVRNVVPGTYKVSASALLSPKAELTFELKEEGQVVEVRLSRPLSPVELGGVAAVIIVMLIVLGLRARIRAA